MIASQSAADLEAALRVELERVAAAGGHRMDVATKSPGDMPSAHDRVAAAKRALLFAIARYGAAWIDGYIAPNGDRYGELNGAQFYLELTGEHDPRPDAGFTGGSGDPVDER